MAEVEQEEKSKSDFLEKHRQHEDIQDQIQEDQEKKRQPKFEYINEQIDKYQTNYE